ncbi:MAG: hypothetical protein Q4G36_02780 [Paracoccus sp. (in: a-proteobacteria)]|nr:hypothetical protein [Paracoccus sp. (in: a-proteobacteria)]
MRALRITLIFLVAGFAIGYALIWLGFSWLASSRPDGDVRPEQAAAIRGHIPFLADLDFDAGPVTLAIDAGASDAGPVLIRDQDLLRAHQQSAVLADTGANTRRTIVGALFGRERTPAIRIWQNGARTSYDCYAPGCANDEATQAALAPLIAAGAPIVRHDLSFTDYAAYIEAHAEAQADPGRFAPLPPPDRETLPYYVELQLPVGIYNADDEAELHAMIQWLEASSAALHSNIDGIRLEDDLSFHTEPVFMRNSCNGRALDPVPGIEIFRSTIRFRATEPAVRQMQGRELSFLLPPPVGLADPVAIGANAFPDTPPRCLGFARPENMALTPVMSEPIRREYRLIYETAAP